RRPPPTRDLRQAPRAPQAQTGGREPQAPPPNAQAQEAFREHLIRFTRTTNKPGPVDSHRQRGPLLGRSRFSCILKIKQTQETIPRAVLVDLRGWVELDCVQYRHKEWQMADYFPLPPPQAVPSNPHGSRNPIGLPAAYMYWFTPPKYPIGSRVRNRPASGEY